MSALGSCAISVVAPEATSCANKAAVLRPRESVQYSVWPSTVKPSGLVVCESSSPTWAIGAGSTLPPVIRK
jgi:hypothetical protein